MLTPQDIENKEFTKAVFGGYDMKDVDDFLDELTEDFTQLEKENTILKSKIKVLVDKVEEYRSTEDSMRMALLNAQKLGDDILAESKKKGEALLGDAETEAKRRAAAVLASIREEELRLTAARERTGSFVTRAKALGDEYMNMLASLAAAIPQEDAAPDRDAAPDQEINSFVTRMLGDDDAEPAEDPPQEEPPEEEYTPRPKFDFNDLKFGSNYGGDGED